MTRADLEAAGSQQDGKLKLDQDLPTMSGSIVEGGVSAEEKSGFQPRPLSNGERLQPGEKTIFPRIAGKTIETAGGRFVLREAMSIRTEGAIALLER